MTALLNLDTGLNVYQVERLFLHRLDSYLFVKTRMVVRMLDSKKPLTFKGKARQANWLHL